MKDKEIKPVCIRFQIHYYGLLFWTGQSSNLGVVMLMYVHDKR